MGGVTWGTFEVVGLVLVVLLPPVFFVPSYLFYRRRHTDALIRARMPMAVLIANAAGFSFSIVLAVRRLMGAWLPCGIVLWTEFAGVVIMGLTYMLRAHAMWFRGRNAEEMVNLYERALLDTKVTGGAVGGGGGTVSIKRGSARPARRQNSSSITSAWAAGSGGRTSADSQPQSPSFGPASPPASPPPPLFETEEKEEDSSSAEAAGLTDSLRSKRNSAPTPMREMAIVIEHRRKTETDAGDSSLAEQARARRKRRAPMNLASIGLPGQLDVTRQSSADSAASEGGSPSGSAAAAAVPHSHTGLTIDTAGAAGSLSGSAPGSPLNSPPSMVSVLSFNGTSNLYGGIMISKDNAIGNRARRWQHPSFFAGVLAALCTAMLMPALVYSALRPSVLTERKEICGTGATQMLLAFYVVACSFACWKVSHRFASMVERFRLRDEMHRIGVACVVAVVLWLPWRVGAASDFNLKTFPAGTLVAVGLPVALMLISTAWPLRLAAIERRECARVTGGNATAAAFSVDANGEVRSLATLDSTLMTPAALEVYRHFMSREFNLESLLLWEEVQRFRRGVVRSRMMHRPLRFYGYAARRAREIFSEYIDTNAPMQVNVSSAVVKSTLAELEALEAAYETEKARSGHCPRKHEAEMSRSRKEDRALESASLAPEQLKRMAKKAKSANASETVVADDGAGNAVAVLVPKPPPMEAEGGGGGGDGDGRGGSFRGGSFRGGSLRKSAGNDNSRTSRQNFRNRSTLTAAFSLAPAAGGSSPMQSPRNRSATVEMGSMLEEPLSPGRASAQRVGYGPRVPSHGDAETPMDGDRVAAIFDEAQRVVYRLMYSDSFPRFKLSPEYKALVERIEREETERVAVEHVMGVS